MLSLRTMSHKVQGGSVKRRPKQPSGVRDGWDDRCPGGTSVVDLSPPNGLLNCRCTVRGITKYRAYIKVWTRREKAEV
jgi:hypothetical protein